MLSDSVLLLRLALLRVVHAAAGAEERLLREATRMRWALRDRIESSSSTSSSSSSSALAPALLKSAIWVLTLCVRLLTWFLSLLALPVKLQRRWLWGAETTKSLKASSASASTSTSTTSTTTSKQQARGRPPPRPATEAAVVLAEAREEEIPLERVADVLGWCFDSGLERLLVFDPAGHVKRRAPELSEELLRRRKRRSEAATTTTTLQQSWAGPLFSISSPSSSSSASPSPTNFHVHLLSGEDTEAPLLAAAAAVAVARKERGEEGEGDKARSFAAALPSAAAASLPQTKEEEDERPPPSSSSSSSTRDLDAALAATRFGEPSTAKPHVCLCYGRSFTLAGFPAWGLAQSEVYFLGEIAGATRAGVREACKRFVTTAQRFGR